MQQADRTPPTVAYALYSVSSRVLPGQDLDLNLDLESLAYYGAALLSNWCCILIRHLLMEILVIVIVSLDHMKN